MEWTDLLRDLERTLANLASQGVRYLNVAPDAELAALRPAPSAPAVEPPFAAAPAASPGRRLSELIEQPARTPDAREPEAPAPAWSGKPVGEIGSLESLFLQYKGCLACKLGPTRNKFVFGTGHERPRILFIGEGPGAEEDQQGLPFVGRAGQLLTGLIQALGLVREDVYIANVIKCRPPGNRNPEPDEIASCRPILQRQIELLDPALIVTLGNVPLKALNPNAGGITKERSRVFTYERWRVLPTFHPSYLLRSPDAIGDCWSDFRAAFALAYPDA